MATKISDVLLPIKRLINVITKETKIETSTSFKSSCKIVSPYTIPKEAPIRHKVTEYVINFLQIIVESGTPILFQMMSSGSGARLTVTLTYLRVISSIILKYVELWQQLIKYRIFAAIEVGLLSSIMFADWLWARVKKQVVFPLLFSSWLYSFFALFSISIAFFFLLCNIT